MRHCTQFISADLYPCTWEFIYFSCIHVCLDLYSTWNFLTSTIFLYRANFVDSSSGFFFIVNNKLTPPPSSPPSPPPLAAFAFVWRLSVKWEENSHFIPKQKPLPRLEWSKDFTSIFLNTVLLSLCKVKFDP